MTWMHDLSAKPDVHNPNKWLAKEFFGHPIKWQYDENTGEAVAVATIADPKDAAQAKKVKWVSPSIVYDYVDQTGRKWPGASVLHIASTPQPVQLGLTPVSDFTAYRQTLLSRAASNAVWLSYGTGVTRMQPNEEDEVIAEGELPVPGGEEMVGEETEDGGMGGDDGMADLNDIIGLFEKFGVEVPEGDYASIKELKDAVQAAVDKALAGKGTDDMGAMGKDKEKDHAAAMMPPVLMSVAPSIPQHAEFIVRDAESRANRFREQINDLAKSGRIDITRRNEMLADLGAVNLSMDPHRFYDSQFKFHPPALAAEIAAYEKLPPGRFSQQELDSRAKQATMLSITRPTVGVPAPGLAGEPEDDTMLKHLAAQRKITLEEARRMTKRPQQ
jgi:hypothetical protein